MNSDSDSFGRLLHAEWTKLRTVRGWIVALGFAAAVIVGLGVAPGAQGSCGKHGPESECVVPHGPEGQEVTDSFYFAHQTLSGDGSITVRLAALTGRIDDGEPDGGGAAGPVASGVGDEAGANARPGVVPWAKTGLIIKDGTATGSAYAAVMLTGGHGVRMQYNYVHDTAGTPAVTARWLRLTRSGDTITGAESADGQAWTTIDTVRLAGLPTTVQAGLFATSPDYERASKESFGLVGTQGGPSQATGTFDHLDREGTWAGTDWQGKRIGGSPNAPAFQLGKLAQHADEFTVTGSGDIAPSIASGGTSLSQTLVGTFVGLIVVIVVATLFMTAEYRRGLIATTLTASPRRGRVLAAKAIVVGVATYVVGLVAAAVVITLGQKVLRGNGVFVHPASMPTEFRMIAGTAALLAVAAVFAVAIGTLLRRSAAAVAAVTVVIVLPYLLAISVLPVGAAQFMLRVTPAAAFAVQQSATQYAQVDALYTPINGFFPLSPWAGFAVLAVWTALAVGLAGYVLRRRDV
jgi:ABC-type transport system involved in multi-copper enzyme maturation permease subunit